MKRFPLWDCMLLSMHGALGAGHFFGVTLNGIERSDTLQGFCGDGMLVGCVQIEELATRMRQARKLGDAACQQRLKTDTVFRNSAI